MSQFKNPLPGVPTIESPFFDEIIASRSPPLTDFELKVASDLRRDGYAVITFPDPQFDQRADAIRSSLEGSFEWDRWREEGFAAGRGLRIQDAWRFNEDVRALASNPAILNLLQRLYGRRAHPFQTLNFPVGTQQHFHTDIVHFSSVPQGFMCGVWVALEDTDADNGPLMYFPGSHRWPVYSLEHIGVTGRVADDVFHDLWQRLAALHGSTPRQFHARRGQALIWAANLLHGGSRQNLITRTRWSQVTHYFFEQCAYYTPMHSDALTGRLAFRELIDISTDERLSPSGATLPVDFDAAAYLQANPDLVAAGVDPVQHWLIHGHREGRPLRK